MHIQTINLKPPIPSLPYPQNPRLFTFSNFPPIPTTATRHVCFPHRALVSAPNRTAGPLHECSTNLHAAALKPIDVATLGNLCLDIVLNVPNLPPSSPLDRKAYMDRLASSPPDTRFWEAGGNCNVAIAASRLGLNCAAIGHVGGEIYGRFLQDVLRDEGISMVGMSQDVQSTSGSSETLLCWVLVDPLQKHGFCSQADFSAEPLYSWINGLSGEVKTAIKQSKIMFCNGYGFDELSPSLIMSAVEYAAEVGTAVFFDPGPKGKSLSTGTPDEQRALNLLLRMSDVLLLTSDEVESLTGIKDPVLAGQALLRKGLRTKWVIIKMGPKGSILITNSSITCAPAFKVNVTDTVGCGDSFVAAVAFGFIHNMPKVNTLATANAVGAATAMGCGAGRNVATLKQVKELIEAADLYEDYAFWNELLGENTSENITFVSKLGINGRNSNSYNFVDLQKVASELLLQLEYAQLEGNVSS